MSNSLPDFRPTTPTTTAKVIKVGEIKCYVSSKSSTPEKPKTVPVLYTYRDVLYDMDGWADSKKFLPEDFDLVYLRLKREKTIRGWISGTVWVGLRLKVDDEVIFWKRDEEKDEDEEKDK